MKKLIFILFIALMTFSLAAVDLENAMDAIEYGIENQEKAFITGKTDYVIEGMMVNETTDVYNNLELVSYHIEDDGESVLLRGTLGEEWVTNVNKVISTYTKEDGSPLTVEDFTNNKGTFIKIKTIAEPDTNFALFVPKDTVLRVEIAWGDILYTNASETDHGDGDYLVCNNVNGQPDISDVWVVNGAVFKTTYDLTNESK